jgi:hypothetical protein
MLAREQLRVLSLLFLSLAVNVAPVTAEPISARYAVHVVTSNVGPIDAHFNLLVTFDDDVTHVGGFFFLYRIPTFSEPPLPVPLARRTRV